MNFSGNDKFNRKKSRISGNYLFFFFFDLIHNYFENYEHSNMIINPPPPKKKEGKNFKIIHNYIYMWLET